MATIGFMKSRYLPPRISGLAESCEQLVDKSTKISPLMKKRWSPHQSLAKSKNFVISSNLLSLLLCFVIFAVNSCTSCTTTIGATVNVKTVPYPLPGMTFDWLWPPLPSYVGWWLCLFPVVSSSFFLFLRRFSAVADWMSAKTAILPHMTWS